MRTIDDLLALAALVRDLKGEDETAARPPDLVRLVVDDVTLLRGDEIVAHVRGKGGACVCCRCRDGGCRRSRLR